MAHNQNFIPSSAPICTIIHFHSEEVQEVRYQKLGEYLWFPLSNVLVFWWYKSLCKVSYLALSLLAFHDCWKGHKSEDRVIFLTYGKHIHITWHPFVSMAAAASQGYFFPLTYSWPDWHFTWLNVGPNGILLMILQCQCHIYCVDLRDTNKQKHIHC